MVTILFLSETGEVVSLSVSKNEDLNTSHRYGKWNITTNEITLNDYGWTLFQLHRKEIRKLQPMFQLLEKVAE